jgi:heme-degrading monooxygenase HmoA
MIIERVEIPVKDVDGFIEAMKDGRKIFSGAKGFHGIEVARGIESANKVLLLLRWDAVEDHVAFTKTPAFTAFKTLAGPFFAGPSSMEHFKIV